MSLRRKQPGPVAVAFHESGHAVVADLLSYWVGTVSIIPAASNLGTALWKTPKGAPVIHRAIVALAGPVGEHLRRHPSGSFDILQASAKELAWTGLLIRERGQTWPLPLDNHPTYRQVLAVTTDLLQTNWQAVETVARQLLEYKEISGHAVAAAVDNQGCNRSRVA